MSAFGIAKLTVVKTVCGVAFAYFVTPVFHLPLGVFRSADHPELYVLEALVAIMPFMACVTAAGFLYGRIYRDAETGCWKYEANERALGMAIPAFCVFALLATWPALVSHFSRVIL